MKKIVGWTVFIIVVSVFIWAGRGNVAHTANATSSMEGLEFLNKLRTEMGVPTVTYHPQLEESSINHSQYLVRHPGTPAHNEVQGKEFFTGTNVAERIQHTGYQSNESWVAVELVSSIHSSNIVKTIDGFLETAYHRIPLLMPNLKEVGYGTEAYASTLNATMNYDTAWDEPIVYPYPNQTEVYRSFLGRTENPNPLEAFGIEESGTVISLTVERKYAKEMLPFETSITDSQGREVPHFKEENHQVSMMNTVFLYPKEPLLPLETYHVSIRYKGKEVAWSFTTKGWDSEEVEEVFVDYQAGLFWEDSVKWGAAKGIIQGKKQMGQRWLAPNDSVTTIEALAMIYRSFQIPFSSSLGSWETPYWEQAIEDGLVASVINKDANRGDIARWLYQLTYESIPTERLAIDWLKEEGLAKGKDKEGSFYSNDTLTRAELVTFLHRYTEWKLQE